MLAALAESADISANQMLKARHHKDLLPKWQCTTHMLSAHALYALLLSTRLLACVLPD